jgi:hypothetical protein
MSDQAESTKREPPTQKFRLSVHGEGIAVDREIDVVVALQVVSMLMGGAPPAGGQHAIPGIHHQASATSPATSLREKLDAANAKRWPDKIVVIGQHLQSAGKASFTKGEVRNLFPSAGEGKAGNYTRDFGWAVRNGWVSPLPESTKDFYVTQKGREAITKQFSGEVKKATAQPKGSRRRKKATSTTAPAE